jgi:RNA polymerase sigma-70 factor (ECF subfamily)
VLRICQRVLFDADEAQDAAQETFVTAFRALSSWRADGPFGAWIGRIAVRTAVRRAKQRKTVNHLRAEIYQGVDDDSRRLSSDEARASRRLDPAIIVAQTEDDRAIRAAVSALPEPYREVVALRFFGEHSLTEISAQTGRPLPTIKTQLRRGLLRLAPALEGGQP